MQAESPDPSPIRILPSRLAPRLPALDTPAEARIRLSRLLQEAQSPADLWIKKLSETKKDIELHLARYSDGLEETLLKMNPDAGLQAELISRERSMTEVTLRAMVQLWQQSGSLDPAATVAKKASEALPRVVILGSGWGSHAVAKVIDANKFQSIFISPRSYFIFTPMLASTSVGTVEYRSICEPMRSANPLIDFYEASVVSVDPRKKLVRCHAVSEGGARRSSSSGEFEVPYDFLVVGVGMAPNTFGIPGVAEHCLFLKEVEDAKRLRARIVDAFEAASLPDVAEEALRNLLTFVVVGGGPTGVEFSGELFDFLQQDLKRFYPRLVPFVSTLMIQSGQAILEQFDAPLQVMRVYQRARGITHKSNHVCRSVCVCTHECI